MQKVLLLLSFITSSLFSMELALVQKPNKMGIDSSSMFVPNQLGLLDLYHSKKGFYIRQDDKKQSIKRYNMDPMLRDITNTQLKGFLANGYLSVNQMDDGEYSLKAKQRLNGGGPLLGLAAYWITKSICYGTLAAALAGSMAGVKATISPGTSGTSPYPPTINERITGALTEVTHAGMQMGLATAGATATVPLASGAVSYAGTVSLSSLVASGAVSGSSTIMTAGPVAISTVATGLGTGGAALVTQAAITGAGLTHEAALVSAAGISATAGTTLGVTGTIELIALKVGLFFGMTPTV